MSAAFIFPSAWPTTITRSETGSAMPTRSSAAAVPLALICARLAGVKPNSAGTRSADPWRTKDEM